MKKIILFLLLSLSLFSKDLIVGMELAYPPFEMSDKNGNPSGFSVEFIQKFASENNLTLKIKNIAWDGLIPALKTKKIDLIISSMTITKERLKSIDFSDSYLKTKLAILTSKNSNIKTLKDLDGKIIALKLGTSGHLYAQKYLKNSTLNIFDSENTAVLEVLQGKADAFFYDQLSIYKINQKNKDKTKAIFDVFGNQEESWGIAIRKDENILKEKLNNFIRKSKEDGYLDYLKEKYLKELKDKF